MLDSIFIVALDLIDDEKRKRRRSSRKKSRWKYMNWDKFSFHHSQILFFAASYERSKNEIFLLIKKTTSLEGKKSSLLMSTNKILSASIFLSSFYYFYRYNNNDYLRIRNPNSFSWSCCILQAPLFFFSLFSLLIFSLIRYIVCVVLIQVRGKYLKFFISKYDAYQYCSCISFKTKLCKQATWMREWALEKNRERESIGVKWSSINNEKLLIYLCILRAWVENCWNNWKK